MIRDNIAKGSTSHGLPPRASSIDSVQVKVVVNGKAHWLGCDDETLKALSLKPGDLIDITKVMRAEVTLRHLTDGTETVLVAVDPGELVRRTRKLIAVCFEDGEPPDELLDNTILRHIGIPPREDGWSAKE